MKVVQLEKKDCIEFVLKKHYSHRFPIFWRAYGLIEDDMLNGVCVFGQPSPTINKCAFKDRDFRLYELSRLVVQSKTKNASSFLVGNALRMIEPKPCAIISYADTSQNHCGYIYQATNWLYTGAVVGHDSTYLVDGVPTHPMTLYDRGITDPKRWAKENNIPIVKPLPKHRYFYLVGSKTDKKNMLAKLAYPIVTPYPKLDPVRYDDGEILNIKFQ